MMVGRPLSDLFPRTDSPLGDEVLRVDELALTGSTQAETRCRTGVVHPAPRRDPRRRRADGRRTPELLEALFGSTPAAGSAAGYYLDRVNGGSPRRRRRSMPGSAFVTERLARRRAWITWRCPSAPRDARRLASLPALTTSCAGAPRTPPCSARSPSCGSDAERQRCGRHIVERQPAEVALASASTSPGCCSSTSRRAASTSAQGGDLRADGASWPVRAGIVMASSELAELLAMCGPDPRAERRAVTAELSRRGDPERMIEAATSSCRWWRRDRPRRARRRPAVLARRSHRRRLGDDARRAGRPVALPERFPGSSPSSSSRRSSPRCATGRTCPPLARPVEHRALRVGERIIAVGMTLVIPTGGSTLSVGAVMALCGSPRRLDDDHGSGRS